MNQRTTLVTGAGFACLAVILAASGAHGLKATLEASGKREVFELAAQYQFYHALALLITGILMNFYPDKKLRYAATSFVLGIFLFSGSLYGLSFIKLGILGPITPLGGVCFIIGWILMILGILKK